MFIKCDITEIFIMIWNFHCFQVKSDHIAFILCWQKHSPSVDHHDLKPLSYGMDITDNSGKPPIAQYSMSHHHQSLGRTLFLKRSRHYYGHPYSQRDSVSHVNALTSQGKIFHFMHILLLGIQLTFIKSLAKCKLLQWYGYNR